MLYDLIQKRRGKEKIVMTGDLSKVNDKMRQLRKSQAKGIGKKNDRVEYWVEQSTETLKSNFKPHKITLSPKSGPERSS